MTTKTLPKRLREELVKYSKTCKENEILDTCVLQCVPLKNSNDTQKYKSMQKNRTIRLSKHDVTKIDKARLINTMGRNAGVAQFNKFLMGLPNGIKHHIFGHLLQTTNVNSAVMIESILKDETIANTLKHTVRDILLWDTSTST